MCGIVGYIGNKNTQSVLVEGLKSSSIVVMILQVSQYSHRKVCKSRKLLVVLRTLKPSWMVHHW